MLTFPTSRAQDPILGYFFFHDLGDGCLGSKYSNTVNMILFAECALRTAGSQTAPPDIFIGTYHTTWLESNTTIPVQAFQSVLTIERKRNSRGQYSLTWRGENGRKNILYHGEGMLCGEFLVGSYWDDFVNACIGREIL